MNNALAKPPVLIFLATLGALLPLAAGLWRGVEIGLLVLSGVVLIMTVALLWKSLLGLTGDNDLTLEEAMAMATPTVEEEQKRSVLRILKDLEYERSVGKISEEDFRKLSAVYRARAKDLIVVVDERLAEKRQRAERLLEKRLRQPAAQVKNRRVEAPSNLEATDEAAEPETDEAASALDSTPEHDSSPSPTGAETSFGAADDAPPLICLECDTKNDPDARFCKACGAEVEDKSA